MIDWSQDGAHFAASGRVAAPVYQEARPFPHIVIDNILPEPLADAVLAEFDEAIERREWENRAHANSQKLTLNHEEELGDRTREVIARLNGSRFASFLEALTGVEGVIPDPHLWGGGLHRIEPGGFLNVHADFNWHGRLELDRRLNLLLYLNKDWPEEYGGHLELWDTDMTACQKAILPVFNRCVIFNTTDYSMHGHPEPLKAPPGRARKSLALYYYSNGRPEGETYRGYSKRTDYRQTPAQRNGAMLDRLAPLIPPFIFERLQKRSA